MLPVWICLPLDVRAGIIVIGFVVVFIAMPSELFCDWYYFGGVVDMVIMRLRRPFLYSDFAILIILELLWTN